MQAGPYRVICKWIDSTRFDDERFRDDHRTMYKLYSVRNCYRNRMGSLVIVVLSQRDNRMMNSAGVPPIIDYPVTLRVQAGVFLIQKDCRSVTV